MIKPNTVPESISKFAKDKKWLVFKTSAKTGVGVNELFEAAVLSTFNEPVGQLQAHKLRELYTTRQLTIPLGDWGKSNTLSRAASGRRDSYGSDLQNMSPVSLSKMGLRAAKAEETFTLSKDETKIPSEPTSQQRDIASVELQKLEAERSGGLLSTLSRLCCG